MGPHSIPAVIAGGVTQHQQRCDVGAGPVHAGAFEAGFDQRLVGALHDAAANRLALRPEGRVLQLGHTLVEIGERLAHLRRWRLCLNSHLLVQRGQQRLGAGMFEAAELARQPTQVVGSECWPHEGHALGSMGEVEDAGRPPGGSAGRRNPESTRPRR
jgi:hypothetical protein